MDFNLVLYRREMEDLLRLALSVAEERLGGERVYSFSIWTDPDAAVSAISIDTRSHSAAQLSILGAFARSMDEKYAGTPHEQFTKPLLRLPEGNLNPAAFAYRNLAMADHASFPRHWATETDGRCWQLLGPALHDVAYDARAKIANLLLEPDAEVGVNTASDWYTHRQPIAVS